MSVDPSKVINKEYRLESTVYRTGCPCKRVPSYQISIPSEKRADIIHKFTTMFFVHKAKNGQIKNSLSLAAFHHELELNYLLLRNSGSSNILLSKITFNCLITEKSGKEYRKYIPFDLKIPGANGDNIEEKDDEIVFSYDWLEKEYKSKRNLYATLEHYYNIGRQKVNPRLYKHGNSPNYNPRYSKYDQFIRHTEQLLIAYLALPEASTMLCNRLRTEIRGKYPEVSAVKIYNMGLHMHSTKTCCAPCEYALIGLMNDSNGFMQAGKHLSFLSNFKQICSIPNERISFTLPKKSNFRLLVTVTASNPDIGHQKQPDYFPKKLEPQETFPSFEILVKENSASQKIFTTMLDVNYDLRRLPESFNLIDKTVGISGSKATKGSPGTKKKVSEIRKREDDDLIDKFSLLKV